MNPTWTARGLLIGLVVIGAGVFFTGLGWGLPSRAIDPFLFGDVPPWSGEKILRLAGERPDDPRHGADVDRDPLQGRDDPIHLNSDDEQRAEIIRRYRLYTYQPDEASTMMALAAMRPAEGRLDPKLYQYGGLWIYPIGVMLKAASMCHAITLINDVAFYLDYPEEFGKFYLFSRGYSAAWGLIGIVIVFSLARRLSRGDVTVAAAAALCFTLMPVAVNMAHEGKPHLAGAVLMLLAIRSAIHYLDTERARAWVIAALLCGAAQGMVLSSLPIFVIIPAMFILHRDRLSVIITRSLAGLSVAVGIYIATNPYVLINLLSNREVLASNLGTSAGMYRIGPWGPAIVDAVWLIGHGTSSVVAAVGILAVIANVAGRFKHGSTPTEPNDRRAGWLLALPAVLVAIQFTALAAGKPGEYGRFAILPDVALAIAAVVAVGRGAPHAWIRSLGLIALVATTGGAGLPYVRGFVRDCSPPTTRIVAAERIQQHRREGATTLAVLAEPAPYVMPPFNLFTWDLVLLPADHEVVPGQTADIYVRPWGTVRFDVERSAPPIRMRQPAERWDPTPISWANKTFEVMAPAQPARPAWHPAP